MLCTSFIELKRQSILLNGYKSKAKSESKSQINLEMSSLFTDSLDSFLQSTMASSNKIYKPISLQGVFAILP